MASSQLSMAPRKAPAPGGRSSEAGGGGLRSDHVPDGKKTADRAEEEHSHRASGAAFHLRAAGMASTRRVLSTLWKSTLSLTTRWYPQATHHFD
jgi:hypothetical protein